MSSATPTHRALVIDELGKDPTIQQLPTPTATAGSAVVRVLASGVVPYSNSIIQQSGPRSYPLIVPLTFGTSAVGRIESIGNDATILKPGDLVYVDMVIRARDQPTAWTMLGYHAGTAPKLMQGEWRHGTYAEIVKAPIENCFKLSESRLLGELEYDASELCAMTSQLIAFGGLREVDLKPGETVIVAPATGHFGGAAIGVALSMGAVVIAAGRNKDSLDRIRHTYAATGRIKTVQFSGDAGADTKSLRTAVGVPADSTIAGADIYADFSPPGAGDSPHFAACFEAVRINGRIVLDGGIRENIPFPYQTTMRRSLRIQGKFMYTREEVQLFIKMSEAGLLRATVPRDMLKVDRFALGDWKEAFDTAEANASWGNLSVIEPGRNL